MKRVDILTIFPGMVTPYTEESILGRAQKSGLLNIEAHDLRSFTEDKHGKVDDTPYGGGAGMVMTVQPFDSALRKIKQSRKKTRVILTAPSGKRFTQEDARRLAEYDQVIFLCGRYEGIDARVEEHFCDESLSIGDYVLTGGELPALVMTDALARMIPGVLGNQDSLKEESHTDGALEYPHYTKPETYTIKRGLLGRKKLDVSVPPVLTSGNHAAIEAWRKAQSELKQSSDNK